MTLQVLDPGLFTLVVDSGRPDCRGLGVPPGGAADCWSLALGNGLVGNPPDAAALEVTMHGPRLRASCPLACVLYGAPFDLASDRQAFHVGVTFTLQEGEELTIGGTPSRMRAYLCIRGGIQAKTILGSRSGLAPVAAGAELPCVSGTVGRRSVRLPATWEAEPRALRVIDGPQARWFRDDLCGRRFSVEPASNRMGLRLAGEPVVGPDGRPGPGRELVSEPVCPGAIQVTRDGQCIVLGVDGQTIGGYPKIAQVISADLDRLGQFRPGEDVSFVRIGLEEAEALYRRKQADLAAWVTRLRAALPVP